LLRNITIRQLTAVITFLLTAFSLVYTWLMTTFFKSAILFLLFPLLFYFNYLIIKYLLEKYVFRKIKVIYKLIYDSKKEKGPQDLKYDGLDEVNSRVVEWAENTRKEIATLKSLEEYRKNYVGNISHELKTPIFSIQAYLHTLLEGGLYDDKINKDYLQRAVDNTERLQNIVEDLDIITRLESGNAELEMKKFDIRELVSEILEDLAPMAKKREITLHFKEGAAPSFMVYADRESIRQVLNNLLVNSIKYGRDGGTTKVSFYDMDHLVLTEVSDNGLGIDERHLRHVFDRFYRVDSSRSRKQGGSGLGLAIVKHIIEAHDQTINVRSTPEIGSTFGFTLSKASRQ
jgi:two-component system phosphate regulon sensor histidine kinase PhoR